MIPKFRAWDNWRKKMSVVDRIYIDTKGVRLYDDFGEYWRDFRDVGLMQSTGLKDKNGKEIFEGDIVITNAYACIVGFGEYTYFEDEDTQTTAIGFYLSFLNVTPATYAPFEKFYWDNCEVIGNIHENELDLIMYEAWKFNEEIEDET